MTTATQLPTCSTCLYFESGGVGEVWGMTGIYERSGRCHKRAPVLAHPASNKAESQLREAWDGLPSVKSDDHCGEHPDAPLDKTQQLLARIAEQLEIANAQHRQIPIVPGQ